MKLDYFSETFRATIKHSKPEFKGLQKNGNNLPLAILMFKVLSIKPHQIYNIWQQTGNA